MKGNGSEKPDSDVHVVLRMPLHGPIKDKLLSPEGEEASHGPCLPPTDPEQRRQYHELIECARRGGPPGRQ